MEEPDLPDSGDENQHVATAATQDSDSSYSDSDLEDGTDHLKSFLNVHKVGHVPGKYKENKETELPDKTNTGEFAMDYTESDKNVENKSVDDALETKTIEGKSDIKDEQVLKQEDPDFAETGIFGRSMLVIPSLQGDEDVTLSEYILSDEVPIQQTSATNTDCLDKVEKRIKPPVPPKPSPRKSKCLNKDIDKQVQDADELSSEKKSSLPSPRTVKKVEEEIPTSVGTEQQVESQQIGNESNEPVENEEDSHEKDLMEKLDDKDVVNEEEEIDTVDIGSAQDCVFDTTSDNNENTNTSLDEKGEQTEKEEQKNEKADNQVKKSTALAEDSSSDTENEANFVNDFKETDSGKSGTDTDQDMSESEPEGEFQTPENQSMDDKEDEIFYDSHPILSTVQESLSNEVEEKTINVENSEVSNQGEEPGKVEEKVDVKMKIKNFEDSVVVIGKGTIKDIEYESMSSMINSDDIKSSEFQNEASDTQPVKFGSIRNRISMFERPVADETKDSRRKDFAKSEKSCSSSSSFDVLTMEESEDIEMKSDVKSTNLDVKSTSLEDVKSISLEDVKSVSLDDVKSTSLEDVKSTSLEGVKSTSLEDIVMEETHDVTKEDMEKKDETVGNEQHNFSEGEEDSIEDDIPPPIAEKSEKVLESMKSMFVDVPDDDDQDIEPSVTSTKDEIPDADQTSEINVTEQNTSYGPPSYSYLQNLPYQQQEQTQQYPNMQYSEQQGQYLQQQQQQQFPPTSAPGWNQPYNYYQGGNYPYPYAIYNQNMNPGMAYQNQSMQYYQQPYFSQQNFGMPYGYPMQRDTEPFRSQSPSTLTNTSSKETRQQAQTENLMPHSDNSPKRAHSPHVAHHKEVSHPAKSSQQTPDSQHGSSKLTKSKSGDPITKDKTPSPAVRRSVSMTTKSMPVARKKFDKKKNIEKKREPHREIEEEEYKETAKDEDYYLYFKDVNPETKPDNLIFFVEITTDGNVSEEIIFNYTKTCALVTVSLKHKPDLHKVKERIRTKGLDTKHPEVFEVPKPTKIAVSCDQDINNRENLELYFESRKAQDSEPVDLTGDSYESEDGSCFVLDFGDADVVKRICSKKGHCVEGKSLRVSPYFECEGGAIWNTEIHVLKIPDSIDLPYEANYLALLKRQCCSVLKDDLAENNCSLEYTDTGLQLHCTLTPKMTGFKGLAKQWPETCRTVVDKYVSENIIERKMKSTEQAWNELTEFYHSENMKANEEIVTDINTADFEILLIGFNDPVKEVFRSLEEKHAAIEKQLSRITEPIGDIADLKLKLLETVGIFEGLKQSLPDIEIDIVDGVLTVEGQPEDITKVKIKMYELDNQISHKHWSHQFSRECVFFVNNVLTDQVRSLLEKNNTQAVWKMDDNTFDVYAFEDEVNDYEAIGEDFLSSQVIQKAEQILKSAIVEMKEPVQDSIIEVLTSPEWISFSQNITETFENAAELEVKDDREILVHGMKKEAEEVHTSMKDFLDKNAIVSDTLTTGTVNIKFIRTHREDFVKRIERKLEDNKVKIELRDDSIKIRGNKKGIFEAKKEFKMFFEAIICDKHTIQKVAVKNVFKDQNEQGVIEKIEKDTSCLIKIPGENATFVEPGEIADEFEDSDGYMIPVFRRDVTESVQDGYGHAAESSSPLDQCFKAQNGVKVLLVRGELGKQDGNVIVVTTSPNLNLNSGSACKSVLREGGPELQNECKQKYPNEIKFGEIAVINGGGTLECNKVYLTTLPNWNSNHDPEQVLVKVMKDSLELVEKHQKYSIVFCAMGTGQLQYPTDMVARLMYQSVIDFDQRHPQASLKEVKFVLYQKDYATIKAFEEEERFRLSGGGERPKFELKTGNVTIELLIENIAQQKVDGILCSTSPNMDLNRSGACQALVRVGGKTLQEECKSKYSNKLEVGNVVEIGGGKLSCKSVYLTVLPGYDDDAIKILTKVIQTLLQLAQAKGYKSLALPALGTGFLRYPTEEVCQCMFQTVIDWAQKNPGSSITTVKFIMYAKDHAVIQRFKSFILNERGRGRRENRRSTGDSKQQGARPKKPIAEQAPKKLQTAFYNSHTDGIQIGKVKLSVFKDDILRQKTDAIVSSVGKDFEFIGAVAHEIKTRCPKMEEECKKQDNIDKLKKRSVVMTKGYQLPAKHVIHVKFAEDIGDWHERFYKCIEKANGKHLKSIAFPVLGTGKGFKMFDPEAITGCLFDALNDFMQKTKSVSIKDIRLIVYHKQGAMYNPVMDKLHKKVQEAASTGGFTSKGGVVKALTKFKNKVMGREEGTISRQDMQKLLQETSSLDVLIYSDSKANIERCKKELEAKLEESYIKKKIEEYKEIVKTLTPNESDQLEVTALADINIDTSAGIITVVGPSQEVSDVTHDLRMRLLKIQRQRNDTASAEELQKLVQWQYEEVTEKGFEYHAYEKLLNQRIENAYKGNKSKFEFEDNDGKTFVIDFNKLTEYEKSDDQDIVRVVRKDILKAVASALPEEWADMGNNENIKVVSVPNTDKEYQDIETRFITELKTGSYAHRLNFKPDNAKVNKIERIQNRTLYQQYQAKKNQMKELKPNLPATMPIERELWHGTKYEAVTSIQMHGFNRSYSGNANGEPWYGEGVYFAGNASYSARGWLSGAGLAPGSKGYMFLVKTLTGQFCKGQKGMRFLPPVDSKDPTILYDCAVDNPNNPLEFVIFNDTQAYPAYIITFTT